MATLSTSQDGMTFKMNTFPFGRSTDGGESGCFDDNAAGRSFGALMCVQLLWKGTKRGEGTTSEAARGFTRGAREEREREGEREGEGPVPRARRGRVDA